MILSNPFMVDPRVSKEAKSLVNNGHKVTVIVWDRKNDYSENENVEGINLVRIHNTRLMKLLPNDLSRNPVWWRKAYKKGLELYKDDFKFDVVHCHDLDTLQAGVWLKKKLGVKLIYDAHEIFGYMIARNMPKFVVKVAFWMEKKLVKNVDHIITVNEPLKEYFDSVSDKPIVIVMNCGDLIIAKYQPPKNKVFTVSYIGVLHKNRMFPELVDIIGGIEGVRFVIAGKKENLYEEVKKKSNKYDNVEFLGAIPYSSVIPKTLGSDAIICMFDPNDRNSRIGLPNKLFEGMLTGRPVIVTKGLYYNRFIEKEKCGLSIDYSREALKKAVIKLRDNPKLCKELGKNGLTAAKERYNWGNEKLKLLQIYEGLQ